MAYWMRCGYFALQRLYAGVGRVSWSPRFDDLGHLLCGELWELPPSARLPRGLSLKAFVLWHEVLMHGLWPLML